MGSRGSFQPGSEITGVTYDLWCLKVATTDDVVDSKSLLSIVIETIGRILFESNGERHPSLKTLDVELCLAISPCSDQQLCVWKFGERITPNNKLPHDDAQGKGVALLIVLGMVLLQHLRSSPSVLRAVCPLLVAPFTLHSALGETEDFWMVIICLLDVCSLQVPMKDTSSVGTSQT